jgi:hypothetical protein
MMAGSRSWLSGAHGQARMTSDCLGYNDAVLDGSYIIHIVTSESASGFEDML